MVETGRVGSQGWPIKYWYWGGWSKGNKIYNNYLKKTDFSVWDFAIESNHESGMEIYNNTIMGAVDLNNQFKGTYNYSVYIHDNILGPDMAITGSPPSYAGIILEFGNENVLVERNLISNVSPCFLFTPRSGAQINVTIRYNICRNIKTSSYYYEGMRMVEPNNIQINGFYVYNNIFQGYSASAMGYGVSIATDGTGYTGYDMQFINNIIINFGTSSYNGPMTFSTTNIDGLYIKNNIFYNSGNSNAVKLTGTPTNYVNSGNINLNPLFVNAAGGDFHLQAGSPAINNGTNVGLISDFAKNPVSNPPEIGVYEYP
jgi:hypothetical protein